MTAKLAALEDPRLVRLYLLLSELGESDTGTDDPRLAEAADIMAGMAEEAYAAGERNFGEEPDDDQSYHLLDALALESDPRAQRMVDLMRERGWNGWIRLERLPEPPRSTSPST
jgi:hypothetical protein